jgi:hypothetical protein
MEPIVNQPKTEVANKDEPTIAVQTPESNDNTKPKVSPKRPGRQPGAPGHSRTQQLPINVERIHTPEHCAVCGQALHEMADRRAYTARCEIDVAPPSDGTRGLIVSNTTLKVNQVQTK